MAEEVKFKCLRCGHEYVDSYEPGKIEERSCPRCGSNSVRRLKEAGSKGEG